MPMTARVAMSWSALLANDDRIEADAHDRQADGERPPPAEPVAQRPHREQQAGEDQDVGVDDPLELAGGGVEVPLQGGEGHVDDRVVHHDQQQAEAHRRPGRPSGGGSAWRGLPRVQGLGTGHAARALPPQITERKSFGTIQSVTYVTPSSGRQTPAHDLVAVVQHDRLARRHPALAARRSGPPPGRGRAGSTSRRTHRPVGAALDAHRPPPRSAGPRPPIEVHRVGEQLGLPADPHGGRPGRRRRPRSGARRRPAGPRPRRWPTVTSSTASTCADRRARRVDDAPGVQRRARSPRNAGAPARPR